jgi:hypothetical protein
VFGLAAGMVISASRTAWPSYTVAFNKKRGLNKKTGPAVHDDLAARRSIAEGPDRTWLRVCYSLSDTYQLPI